MSKHKNKEEIQNGGSTTSTTATTTTTSLPGLRDVQVIVSHPSLVKENSSKSSKK